MTLLIIEDEKPAANRLIRMLQEYFPGAMLIGELDTVSRAVRWLSDNPSPDLIFCDIQLADGISFEIFEKIKVTAPIIFTTAFDQYAIRAFQVNAIDYLLKPIDPEDLRRAVEKFKAQKLSPNLDIELIKNLLHSKEKSFKSRFLVKFGEKIQSVPVEDVAFFFSEERVTFLQTYSGKKYVLDSILEQVESQVDPEMFFRLNRKYLSHINAIEEVLSYSNSRLKIKLSHCTDSDILVSREKVSELKSWMDR